MGARPMAEPRKQNAKGSASRTLGQGTPCRVPGSPRSATVLDISPSLDDQTTFKSDETKTITTVSKRTLQRNKNHVDMTSVLQEKSQKPKKTGRKATSTRRNDTREPPTWGARSWEVGQWPTPTGKMPGGRQADPPGQGTPTGSPVRPVLRHT